MSSKNSDIRIAERKVVRVLRFLKAGQLGQPALRRPQPVDQLTHVGGHQIGRKLGVPASPFELFDELSTADQLEITRPPRVQDLPRRSPLVQQTTDQHVLVSSTTRIG